MLYKCHACPFFFKKTQSCPLNPDFDHETMIEVGFEVLMVMASFMPYILYGYLGLISLKR